MSKSKEKQTISSEGIQVVPKSKNKSKICEGVKMVIGTKKQTLARKERNVVWAGRARANKM